MSFIFGLIIIDGEHTSVKTVVTSKVGGLAGFITKKDKCIGCKTVLQEQGKSERKNSIVFHRVFLRHGTLLVLQSKRKWLFSKRNWILTRIRRKIYSIMDRMPTMPRCTTRRCYLYQVGFPLFFKLHSRESSFQPWLYNILHAT